MTSQTSHSIDGFSFFLILTATWLLVLSTGSVEARRPYSANHIHEPRGDLRLSKKTVPTGIIGVPSAEQIVSLLIRRGGYRAARKPGLRRRRQASWKDELADDSRVDLKDYNSNTGYRVEAFQEARPPGFGRASNSTQKLGCYYFDVQKNIPEHSRVHFAVLTIFRRCKSGAPLDVDASVVQDTNSGRSPFQDSVNISCEGRSGGDWLRLIVTPFVQDWISEPSNQNHRSLCLIASEANSSRRLSLFSLQAGNIRAGKNRHAILTVIYEAGALNNQPTCSPEGQGSLENQTCCRKPYYVDFSARWNKKIIFPRGYDAYTCHGWCPLHPSLSASERGFNSGALSQWFSLVHRQCRPSQRAAITVLLMDTVGHLHLQRISNAVVLACSCGI